MRAMQVQALGPPHHALRLVELAERPPGPGEVAIEVRAIGCNFPDILACEGTYQVKPALPFAPGHELAGVVAEVGEGVRHLRPGQRVLALMAWGAYQSRVVVPTRDVFALPEAMPYAEAAAFGVVYQTAIAALCHRTRLASGETLLVHAAAGGVGIAAVQLGKALGARVIATAGGPRKVLVATQAGADVAIDYTREDWVARVREETGQRGADVIFDPVGGDVFDGSTRCVAWEGRILIIGFAGGRIASVATNRVLLKNIDIIGVHWGPYRERQPALVDTWMSRLLAMVESGKLRPMVSGHYPLERAADALAAIASRGSVGKVVLEP
jgi:NADPH2:quinone reductase